MTTTITMQPVESSQIHSIGHDPESNKLAIRFKTKDGRPTSLYHYDHVTAADFEAFRTADSIGSFFKRNIKPFADKHPYERIEDAPGVASAA
ncbi:KTSC domain-containing protein [Ralstonia nicotianae]